MEQELREKISALVQRAQVGDLQAKEEIYRLMVNKVYYLALKIVKNDQDAMDIMQESFIKAFNKLDTLTDTMAFTTWLYRITSNNSKNLLTRGKKEIFSIDSDDENSNAKEISDLDEEFLPQSAVDNKETQRLVKKIIDELPDAQRSCIMMYYFGEMSVKEIAETLDCSEGTVKSRLNYARKQIKEAVLTLEEREGTKLYNIAPFGLLVLIISSISNEECLAAELTQQLWQDISTDVSLEVNGKLSTKEASAVTTKAAAVISGKIIAGVIVAAVAIGGVVVASNKKEEAVSVAENEVTASATEEPGATEDLGTFGDFSAKKLVVFSDPAVEKGLRAIINKPEGDVYTEDFDGIEELVFTGEYMGVGGMQENAEGYTWADFIYLYEEEQEKFTYIGDFTSLDDLKYLKNLMSVDIIKVNDFNQQKADWLVNCENIRRICISNNENSYCIPDFSKIEKLEVLQISDGRSDSFENEVTINTDFDFSSIGNLTNLKGLYIGVKSISNINFVSNLKKIELIYINGRSGCDLNIDCNIFLGLNNLENLQLRNRNGKDIRLNITNEDIVKSLPNLEEFYINGEDIMN